VKSKYYIITVLSAVLLVLIGALGLSLAGFSSPVAEASGALQQPQQEEAVQGPEHTITVVGEGEVSALPDIAIVQLGVQVYDADVQVATQRAAEDMEAVLAALKEAGVADNDIETSYYNLYVERPYGPEGPTDEVRYQVSNTVQVTIRDLTKLTEILGLAIEAGANNINSVSFDISDPAELRVQARREAVEDAKATAEELATLNEVELGQVVEVSEVIQTGGYFLSERSAAAQGLGGGAGPISPGNVDVTVQLQISYAIVR